MDLIPLAAVASQTLTVDLAEQPCRINVYQKSTGLYCDLLVNDVLVIAGVIARDRNVIVRELYRGFAGDLMFIDTQGTADPDYTGLGGRFVLAYVPVS